MRADATPRPPDGPVEPENLGELTDDAITARFRLWQRRRGHRYSLDDVLTAWEAVRECPDARRCLDLGTGIGSVLLMVADRLETAQLVGVEAQRNSYRLLVRNVARNGLDGRVRPVHGDFREEVQAHMDEAPFDLVTGTPPYLPPGCATPSSDAQRAYARQEFRGGVEAYVEAATRVLAPSGRLVICGDARTPERVERAAHTHGLGVVRRRDAVPRQARKTPLFSVFTLAPGSEAIPTEDAETWVARDQTGARTQAYRDVRAFFGLPSPDDEAPNP